VSSFAKFKDKDNKKEGGLVKFKDKNDKKRRGVGLCKPHLGQNNKGGKGDLNFAKLKDKDK
jgi:hypothetical protein